MYFPMPEGETCFFCDIVQGRAFQWQVVASDELTMTLLNGRQFETGQCMVVPRRHAPTLLDLDDAEGCAVMAAARRVSLALVDAYAPEGVLLYQNNGTGSGQEVPHFHLHVVPRQTGSDWGLGPPHLEKLARDSRSRQQDYRVETKGKRQAVDAIRKHLPRQPPRVNACAIRC